MALKDLLIALIVSLSVRSGQLNTVYSTAEQSQNESSIDATVMMRRERVLLRPPTNITFFLITSNEAVIGWLPPEIFTDHYIYDVNTTLIDPLFNHTNTMIWLNHTYPQPLLSGGGTKSKSEESSTQDDSVNSSEAGVTAVPPVFPISEEEFCHSLDFFANYTVGVNTTDEAVNDYVPHLIKLKDVFKPRNVTADMKNSDIVSYSQSCVQEYHVFYYDNTTSEPTIVKVNATERPEVHLTSLTPGTQYTIHIGAVFVSNKMLNSSSINFETESDSKKRKCTCDWHGTTEQTYECSTNISKPCSCKYGYTGTFCERCGAGFYRTAPIFPCHRCPCASHATRDATCRFKEGFLTCAKCEVGYTGNICHMCDNGYYRHHKYCVPCHCNNNHNRSKPFMCDVITGACHCMHNASGMNCEMCHSGYVGNALHFRNCTLDESLLGVFSVVPQGIIAGICVGVILIISFIVGFIVYWRMSKNPPQRPFWTVELKDDHEGVNFNTVPNDDFTIVDPKMTMDDMEFYENQGGAAQSHGAGKKYARLQENA